jgi:hypothetical protein
MESTSTLGDQLEQHKLTGSENVPGVSKTSNDSHETYTEGHGDFQVTMVPGAKGVKLAKDGKTVLIPQPTNDPEDVLNWKAGKKLRVLISLIFASLVSMPLLNNRER